MWTALKIYPQCGLVNPQSEIGLQARRRHSWIESVRHVSGVDRMMGVTSSPYKAPYPS